MPERRGRLGLGDLVPGRAVSGIVTGGDVTIVAVRMFGPTAAQVTYRRPDGSVEERILYEEDAERLAEVTPGTAGGGFDADPGLFRLAAEALRIRMAARGDAMLAVSTSLLDPLPHQIQAVYNELLPRTPLRFLLADDPGAGKTIMAGLYIKELALRGDLERCLIVAPGGLVEQWQDELLEKFNLDFTLLTRQLTDATIDGNVFDRHPRLIARMDALARSDDLRRLLGDSGWDLVVVDEAHRMSASYFGTELKTTKRYELGRLLGRLTRHLLLMTATPHAGKEEDFQLFMTLLDSDRFSGRYRAGIHRHDVSGLMRRMIKEDLLTFDGKRLFPERRAYTVPYELSHAEQELYEQVTEYVRQEMNRAERLDGRRGNQVGFALTVLQRRLASSPAAIHRSLERRRLRLEARRQEMLSGQAVANAAPTPASVPSDDELDDLTGGELEDLEEQVVDAATAARTVHELELEIAALGELERLAARVLASGDDRKWRELSGLLQDDPLLRDEKGLPRKLIIFTEHRDTLDYLSRRIRTLIGRPEAVVAIHGGTPRPHRRDIRDAFNQDPEVRVLVATDAAGEGLNLQRAHLMVNYDLPWNPNRIEQRFGRIHRIGQTEVCHLWNLVAADTREGQVFQRLLDKIEQQSKAYDGKVYNVLGELFEGEPLRGLLMEAIRYGDRPEVKSRLDQVIDARVGERAVELIKGLALDAHVMGLEDVEAVRLRMEEAQARRLHPHYVRAFFRDAFDRLGGHLRARESGRYEITHIPAVLRDTGRFGLGLGGVVQRRYERVCFDRERVTVPGAARADLIAPGHPLFDAVLEETVHRHGDLLTRGTVLVDASDAGVRPRLLTALVREVVDGHGRSVDRSFAFVELCPDGTAHDAGPAPYLDYRPPTPREAEAAAMLLKEDWLRDGGPARAMDWAVREAVPQHLNRTRERVLPVIERTRAQVEQRLRQEISFWYAQAGKLEMDVAEGKKVRHRPETARAWAEDLERRREQRLAALDKDQALQARPPVVAGCALVVPVGWLVGHLGPAVTPAERAALDALHAADGYETDRRAVAAVLRAERELGRAPEEMAHNNPGYDIRSLSLDGHLVHIEVKGRREGAEHFYVSRNEVLVAKNRGEQHRLALVSVSPHGPECDEIRYLTDAFADTDFGDLKTEGLLLSWQDAWNKGGTPQ
ncbi:helicase-related protein [Streptomyces griseorubiginosus]|uniref:RNA polymerase-associated protein RapA n=1 Tax=Streptomyces griseorubiginosus TaxID=67304 RepID=A0AAI8L120_9ACTN|nr:helicase-related protein [Streptomyces griseorubiginosus]AYC39224.1 RNA polymerase-associated protein RapA [Streptomyces griseorubiginosus]